MKKSLLIALALSASAFTVPLLAQKSIALPLSGNAYLVTPQSKGGDAVTQTGIRQWSNPESIISTYFKTLQTGKLDLAIRVKVDAPAVVNITCEGKTFTLKLKKSDWKTISVGTVEVKEAGYVRIDLQGVSRSGKTFTEISDFMLAGKASQAPLNFVHNFEAYWGRRGPSVHMKYTLPTEPMEYFYNEVTVPLGEDPIGSYYMANGFGEGYMGMQTNSANERRVLFSVWSPFVTDNPKDIPADQQIQLIEKGEHVVTGEFGNEGSGGQSFLRYPWITGETYRFVTRIRPDGKGNTLYSGYFFAPEVGEWKLIATFLRPKTDTWYTNAHSFLENFIPEQGYIGRKVFFDNQWARSVAGEWIELTEGTFTYDATAAAGVRQDYAGGLEENRFFLRNCGFFNENTPLRSRFTRSKRALIPMIDLIQLPQ